MKDDILKQFAIELLTFLKENDYNFEYGNYDLDYIYKQFLIWKIEQL